jgi:hypothetical protein
LLWLFAVSCVSKWILGYIFQSLWWMSLGCGSLLLLSWRIINHELVLIHFTKGASWYRNGWACTQEQSDQISLKLKKQMVCVNLSTS